MWSGSLVSALLGNQFPGAGTVYLDQALHFLLPVHVGDTLTVQIEETVTASQQSTSKMNRSGSISAGITALPFASTNFLGRLATGGESSVTGGGDGQTNSTNTFSGTITVLVIQVMPNGNLLVSGDKQVGVNQNVDVPTWTLVKKSCQGK